MQETYDEDNPLPIDGRGLNRYGIAGVTLCGYQLSTGEIVLGTPSTASGSGAEPEDSRLAAFPSHIEVAGVILVLEEVNLVGKTYDGCPFYNADYV